MSLSISLHMLASAPVAGQVKARLIPVLGAQGACDLQQMLLERALHLPVGRFHERFLWLDDQPAMGLQVLAEAQGWTLIEQPAGDLGERMRRIATLGLAGSDAVVLIGNDCPALDGAYLQAACAALQEQSVVVGPAEDGGYALLGLRSVDVALFNDVPWGTQQVLSVMLQRLQQLDWRPALLPELWAIERPEDLSRLAALDIHL